MVKKKVTDIANWDEELAKSAAAAASVEKPSGGAFFSTKGGILTFNGDPMPGNRMAVIVLESAFVNAYYGSAYDPASPDSPDCYAISRDEDTLTPHEKASSKNAEACDGCRFNEFGSADKGKGKACKNQRRLAVIPAGTFDKQGNFTPFKEVDAFKDAEVAFFNVPPTSTRAWGNYVHQSNAALKRPPFGVFTKIELHQDPKTQFKVTFTVLDNVPNGLLATVKARHEEAREAIMFAFPDKQETPGKGKKPKGDKKKKY